MNYYNEIDPEKAEWIRELIKAGVVAPGDVDERSIADVQPNDLRGYTQCHFFAGIAVWSYALRLAGWSDDRAVWTGSCPCPSFSCAGKGEGFADPRHLWPEWYRLIRECRPGTVFGEQVAAAIGHGWLDLVCGDMEAEKYAIAPAVLGAHSAGAPHIRQRLYFCADTKGDGWGVRNADDERAAGGEVDSSGDDCEVGRDSGPSGDEVLIRADAEGQRSGEGLAHTRWSDERSDARQGSELVSDGGHISGSDSMRHGSSTGIPEPAQRKEGQSSVVNYGDYRGGRGVGWLDENTRQAVEKSGATSGFWADCDWWYGRDGKYRPIGPGLFPLAHGAPARVLRLRGYGDAICAESAAAFIGAYSEARGIA